jgi:hypothetical protein
MKSAIGAGGVACASQASSSAPGRGGPNQACAVFRRVVSGDVEGVAAQASMPSGRIRAADRSGPPSTSAGTMCTRSCHDSRIRGSRLPRGVCRRTGRPSGAHSSRYLVLVGVAVDPPMGAGPDARSAWTVSSGAFVCATNQSTRPACTTVNGRYTRSSSMSFMMVANRSLMPRICSSASGETFSRSSCGRSFRSRVNALTLAI